MFGAFLLVGEQVGGQCRILVRRGAALAGASDRAHGDRAILEPHQDLGRGTDDVKILEVEIEHVRRWIERAQRPVERQRRRLEGLAHPL